MKEKEKFYHGFFVHLGLGERLGFLNVEFDDCGIIFSIHQLNGSQYKSFSGKLSENPPLL